MNKKEYKYEKKLDYRRGIQRTRESSALQFDKLIVYLNGGFIALSVSLVHSFYIEKYGITCLVIFAWSISVISLLLNLISHLTTVKSMDSYLDGEFYKSDSLDKVTIFLNYTSLVFLVTALILFLIFISNT